MEVVRNSMFSFDTQLHPPNLLVAPCSHTSSKPKAAAVTDTPVADAKTADTFVVSTRAEALAQAEAITKEKGITSSEARLAWELVEELAATESHHNDSGSG